MIDVLGYGFYSWASDSEEWQPNIKQEKKISYVLEIFFFSSGVVSEWFLNKFSLYVALI